MEVYMAESTKNQTLKTRTDTEILGNTYDSLRIYRPRLSLGRLTVERATQHNMSSGKALVVKACIEDKALKTYNVKFMNLPLPSDSI